MYKRQELDGYAIGGLAVGEPTEVMYEMISQVAVSYTHLDVYKRQQEKDAVHRRLPRYESPAAAPHSGLEGLQLQCKPRRCQQDVDFQHGLVAEMCIRDSL